MLISQIPSFTQSSKSTRCRNIHSGQSADDAEQRRFGLKETKNDICEDLHHLRINCFDPIMGRSNPHCGVVVFRLVPLFPRRRSIIMTSLFTRR